MTNSRLQPHFTGTNELNYIGVCASLQQWVIADVYHIFYWQGLTHKENTMYLYLYLIWLGFPNRMTPLKLWSIHKRAADHDIINHNMINVISYHYHVWYETLYHAILWKSDMTKSLIQHWNPHHWIAEVSSLSVTANSIEFHPHGLYQWVCARKTNSSALQWSYVFLALTHRYAKLRYDRYPNDSVAGLNSDLTTISIIIINLPSVCYGMPNIPRQQKLSPWQSSSWSDQMRVSPAFVLQ